MLLDRKTRRELWRRGEKAARVAGESLDTMFDAGTSDCGAEVRYRYVPPAMAREYLVALGEMPVGLSPDCGGPVIWVSSEDRRPLLCIACHDLYYEDVRESA